MRSIEHDIAATLVAFLSARGDRIARDHGTLVLYNDGGRAIASLDGAEYDLEIVVRSRA